MGHAAGSWVGPRGVVGAARMNHRGPVIEVTLQPGRDRSVRRRHPWLLSGAVARVRDVKQREPAAGEADSAPGEPGDRAGAWASVLSAKGEVVGYGHYSPRSTIRVRLIAFGADDPGEAVIGHLIASAVERRNGHPLLGRTDAVRLVNAEGDGLPGLVVDRYADVVVVRASTVGMHGRIDAIGEALRKATGARAGMERADGHAARREGYAVREGALWGQVPESVEIDEHGRRFAVDVTRGQKTGFYLDQRDARGLVESLASSRRVLDAFSYTGGFAVAAAKGGARSVTLLESSAAAIDAASAHLAPFASDCTIDARRADAFDGLREAAVRGDRFDLLVVDPPPLARRKADVTAASRAYKHLALHAIRCAAPNAHLLIWSCSYHVGPEQLVRVVGEAAADARCGLHVEQHFGAPVDHPVSIHHPEGDYLHGLLLRVGPEGGQP